MMGRDFHFRDKVRVAVLGATGSVGQRFVSLLANHPWFDLVAVAASERSVGKKYREAASWLLPMTLPPSIAEMEIVPCLSELNCPIIFSALDAAAAAPIETAFAEAGCLVVSNARCHRMRLDVPLLIPEVNSTHLELLKYQRFGRGGIVTNPNCSSIGLTLALKPLYDRFGIEAVHVATMQAISGAGYPGVAGMDIVDNVIPFINGEEDKLEQEPLKILGSFQDGRIDYASMKISAQCNRVAVTDGHMACVSLKLKSKAGRQEVVDAWRQFEGDVHDLTLPFSPQSPVHYFEEDSHPQPKLHRHLDKGMAVSVGRLRECPLMDYKFTILSHNTIRGAAGGAILCAELLMRKGFVFW